MLCRVLRVSRSGFYAWRTRPESTRVQEDRKLVKAIREAHEESYGVYGSPRVFKELKSRAWRVSRKRVARLMKAHGIRSQRKQRFVTTTDSRHACPVSGNLLQRDFSASGPNEKWASDLTYIRTGEGWLYLAVVLDLYSRKAVGWSTSSLLTADLATEAMRAALEQRNPPAGLIHHSDRGSQYASDEYQLLLTFNGILCSMSRKGDCWDNAVVESFFSSLKAELVHRHSWRTRREARNALFVYIEGFYNRRRRHSSLGDISPEEFEEQSVAA